MSDTLAQALLVVLIAVFVIAAAMLWNTAFRSRGKVRIPSIDEARADLQRSVAKARQNIPAPGQVTPHAKSPVKWDHPANQGVLAVLGGSAVVQGLYDSPPGDSGDVPGNHPDIVQHVFETLAAKLPADCRWIVYSRPVLVHPQTGVIFAFGIGSMCVGVRVPESARTSGRWLTRWAFSSGGDAIEQANIGPDWAFEGGGTEYAASGLAAYEYAGKS